MRNVRANSIFVSSSMQFKLIKGLNWLSIILLFSYKLL